MHNNRIMHRDIKPANVLVGAGGTLKLGDLGLGRQFSEHTMEAFSKVRKYCMQGSGERH
jgi:serine/threonine protein kinase